MLRLVRGKKLVVAGSVRDGDTKRYIFTAKEGQRLTIKVVGRDAVFTLYGGAGLEDVIAEEEQTWSGKLPEGDPDSQYALVMTSFYKVATFRLELLLQ